MTQPARDIIFGICDKTGDKDSYFGFFRHESDAKKELETQSNRLKEDFGYRNLIVKNDRVIIEDGRVEEILIIIHPFVLR